MSELLFNAENALIFSASFTLAYGGKIMAGETDRLTGKFGESLWAYLTIEPTRDGKVKLEFRASLADTFPLASERHSYESLLARLQELKGEFETYEMRRVQAVDEMIREKYSNILPNGKRSCW